MLKKLSFLNSIVVIALTTVVISLSSCYPSDDLSIEETDLVYASYYDSVNFSQIKTYYMTDTVYVVRDDTTDHSLIKHNDEIIQLIATNMANYGYTRITDISSDTPDVRVTAAAITVKNVTIGWWYPYYPGWGWGWYWKKSSLSPDYYYPGYPGYYPPGYWWGYPYYSSYTTGTLIMEMANPLDTRIVKNDTVTPIYWTGAVNGVLGTDASNLQRTESGINKAFELSPEIKTN